MSWEASSKVGSLDNVKHVAGGGKIQVRTQHVCVMSTIRIKHTGRETFLLVRCWSCNFPYCHANTIVHILFFHTVIYFPMSI